jgi:hypothetical protein
MGEITLLKVRHAVDMVFLNVLNHSKNKRRKWKKTRFILSINKKIKESMLYRGEFSQNFAIFSLQG